MIFRLLRPDLAVFWAVCGATGGAEAAGNRFEKEIAAYEAADQVSPPPQQAILFTGASGIRLWKTLAEDFPGLVVMNRGFGGSQISDNVFFLERIVIPYRPRTVVLQAGGNDLHVGKSPEQVLADLLSWVTRLRAALPGVRIVYLGQSPSPARWAAREKQQETNRLVRGALEQIPKSVFVETWEACLGEDGLPRPELYSADGLHPTPLQYHLGAQLIRPALEAPGPR